MSLDMMMHVSIAVVCAAVSWACLCRMDKMHKTTRIAFRLKYTLLATGAIAAALAPWMFPDVPRLGGLLFALTVLAFLLLGAPAWRSGAPDYSESDRAPLGPPEL
jgi:hypothetical protein